MVQVQKVQAPLLINRISGVPQDVAILDYEPFSDVGNTKNVVIRYGLIGTERKKVLK